MHDLLAMQSDVYNNYTISEEISFVIGSTVSFSTQPCRMMYTPPLSGTIYNGIKNLYY